MKKGDKVLINGKEYTVDAVLEKSFITYYGGKWNIFNKNIFNNMENDPLKKQEGGSHYVNLAIQPVEYITKNNLDFLQGNIIKYATRHKVKNGAEDIKKIKHYCDLILKLEYNED